MTKNEWLSELKDSLITELPQNEIENNLSYYRDYIDVESKVKKESEILSSLGDPRLIAKTIITTYERQGGTNSQSYRTQDYGDNTDYGCSDQDKADMHSEQMRGPSYTFYSHKLKWYHKAIIFAILGIILALLVIIGGFLLKIFFTIGLPIVIVVLLIQLFRKNK